MVGEMKKSDELLINQQVEVGTSEWKWVESKIARNAAKSLVRFIVFIELGSSSKNGEISAKWYASYFRLLLLKTPSSGYF